jgi:monovalent cation:H+ antiporter, CPA1 family
MFSLFDIIAILLALTASFAWVNHVLLGLPNTIGLLLIGLVASLVLVATELVFPGTAVFREASRIVREIHFSAPLLNGMLGFLLFADDRVTACGKSCPHVSLPTAVVERFR